MKIVSTAVRLAAGCVLALPSLAQEASLETCGNADSARAIIARQHADVEALVKAGKVYDADAETRLKAKMQEVASVGSGSRQRVARITAEHLARYQTEAVSLFQKHVAATIAEQKSEASGDLRSACAYSLEVRRHLRAMVTAHKTYYEGLIAALDAAKAVKL